MLHKKSNAINSRKDNTRFTLSQHRTNIRKAYYRPIIDKSSPGYQAEVGSGEEAGGEGGGGKHPHFFCNHLFFCNNFEELQTVLFEVELIINSAPLT